MKICIRHGTATLLRFCPECRRQEYRNAAVDAIRYLNSKVAALSAANLALSNDMDVVVRKGDNGAE